MKYIYDDGGRSSAGFRGECGDCATRAISIATGMPYREVYNQLQSLQKIYTKECRERVAKTKSSKVRAYYQNATKDHSVRDGTYVEVVHRFMNSIGWEWVPTMKFGTGCKVHLRDDELPSGCIVCRVARHYVAVIEGILHDTWDSQLDGNRCVYGYWKKFTD